MPQDELLVTMPLGGTFYLAMYKTHSRQGQCVLARSSRALDHALRKLLDRKPGVTLGEAFSLEIVAPNAFMHEAYRRQRRKNDIERYVESLKNTVSRMYHEMGWIDDRFEPCAGYLACTDETAIYHNEEEDPTHDECERCHGSVKARSMTDEDLYETFCLPREGLSEAAIEHYDYLIREPEMPTKNRSRSRARPYVEGEPLWSARCSYGHHCDGFYVCEIDDAEWARTRDPEETYNFLLNESAFYFLRGPNIDLAPYQAVLDARAEAVEVCEKKREEECVVERDERDERRLAAFQDFMRTS